MGAMKAAKGEGGVMLSKRGVRICAGRTRESRIEGSPYLVADISVGMPQSGREYREPTGIGALREAIRASQPKHAWKRHSRLIRVISQSSDTNARSRQWPHKVELRRGSQRGTKR